jgi:cob(I)alamin adenosyltransferase
MPIRINRVVTRGGDRGETSLVGGQRVAKDSLRIESFGTVDELNAILGLVTAASREAPSERIASADRRRLLTVLARLQNELFNLGSDLATLPADRHPKQPVLSARHVRTLERTLSDLNEGLPELTSFVLPGGGTVSALLHQARTVCRRAERVTTALSRVEEVSPLTLVYLNRLSDLLFVLSRWVTRAFGEEETLWDPRRG